MNEDSTLLSAEGISEPLIRDYLRKQRAAVSKCWAHPKFMLSTTNEEGKKRSFSFLQYPGVQQIVEDVDRIRIAIRAPKMSLCGISYGTFIAGSYATVYSQSTDKVGWNIVPSFTHSNPHHSSKPPFATLCSR